MIGIIQETKKITSRKSLLEKWKLLNVAFSSTALVIISSTIGLLEVPECKILDRFFSLRPLEPPDNRIVVITISDQDISNVGAWPIPDRVLADLLTKLNKQKPRAIGLDLYRDLPVEPGHEKLVNVFRSTPNLFGVQKRFGVWQVPPPPSLAKLGQVGIVDIASDADDRIRRYLLSARDEQGEVYLSLGTKIALKYLEAEGIKLQSLPGSSEQYKLGRVVFNAFRKDDGGYARADENGYQILLNFRGPQDNFHTISLTDFLNNKFPDRLVRDRIVLIGSTAEGAKDFFLTAYDGTRRTKFSRTPGVFIQANLISQLLSSALDGRLLIQGVTNYLEWLWILFWSLLGAAISWTILEKNYLGKHLSYLGVFLALLVAGGIIFTISYLLFLNGWWIAVLSPWLGLTFSAIACLLLYGNNLRNIAYYDPLTQVANRRYFEQQLAEHLTKKEHISLIMCDVDCFKLYNDTYGHVAGDLCLQQVANTIRKLIRTTDLLARYGGEEFVIILPQTKLESAAKIAERIVNQIRELQITHQTSTVDKYVTLSCGVASIKHDEKLNDALLLEDLILSADRALYTSKQLGRNRFTVMQD
ncbi:MAG TPA: CHASE2 domain-containing protein [Leptolyngbyaceae cyanobacterium]